MDGSRSLRRRETEKAYELLDDGFRTLLRGDREVDNCIVKKMVYRHFGAAAEPCLQVPPAEDPTLLQSAPAEVPVLHPALYAVDPVLQFWTAWLP